MKQFIQSISGRQNNNLKFKIYYILFFILVSGIVFIQISFAEEYNFEKESGLRATAEKTGHKDMLNFQPGTLPESIGLIIGAVLLFLGVIFLILMIYGGYQWMTAGGDEQKVEKAKDLIKNSIIGLIVVLAAYAITEFIRSYSFISSI